MNVIRIGIKELPMRTNVANCLPQQTALISGALFAVPWTIAMISPQFARLKIHFGVRLDWEDIL